MAKNYTELEPWAIFIGALTIGVVLTSLFWAFITPAEVQKIEKEISNATKSQAVSVSMTLEKPEDFIAFCKAINGIPEWDSRGMRQCSREDFSEKSLSVMNFFCKKFNLSLSYGSFGIKCEGKVGFR